MKYIYVVDNVVAEIIPAEDPVFPGVPIEDRYSPEFIALLMAVDASVVVEQNYIYDPATNTFSPPPVWEPVEETTEI